MRQTQDISKPYIIDETVSTDVLQTVLISHLSKAVSAANLGVGELMEAQPTNPHLVNHFLLLEEILVQCKELSDMLAMKRQQASTVE